jgi:cytochrome P450
MPRGPCSHIAEHFTIAGKKLLTVDSTFRPARRQTVARASPIHPSDSVSSKEYGSMNANARELAASFDIEKLTGEFYADPYATYRALRKHEPVKLLPNGSYFLTRYDDLVSAYKNTKLFSSDKKKEFLPKYGDSLLYEHHTTSLVFSDAPAHTRVRRLIMGALSPRAIAEMEPDLIALVDRLLTLSLRKAVSI